MLDLDATDRIALEFERLVAIGREELASRSAAERSVYYVVAARCEIDINGFSSVYKQGLNSEELSILIDGLMQIGEPVLAEELQQGYDLLKAEEFYHHLDWSRITQATKNQIKTIGCFVGDQLWELDEKLANLLDAAGDLGIG